MVGFKHFYEKSIVKKASVNVPGHGQKQDALRLFPGQSQFVKQELAQCIFKIIHIRQARKTFDFNGYLLLSTLCTQHLRTQINEALTLAQADEIRVMCNGPSLAFQRSTNLSVIFGSSHSR